MNKKLLEIIARLKGQATSLMGLPPAEQFEDKSPGRVAVEMASRAAKGIEGDLGEFETAFTGLVGELATQAEQAAEQKLIASGKYMLKDDATKATEDAVSAARTEERNKIETERQDAERASQLVVDRRKQVVTDKLLVDADAASLPATVLSGDNWKDNVAAVAARLKGLPATATALRASALSLPLDEEGNRRFGDMATMFNDGIKTAAGGKLPPGFVIQGDRATGTELATKDKQFVGF